MRSRLLVGTASVPLLVVALAACGGGGHEGHTAAEHSSAVAASSAASSASASQPAASGSASQPAASGSGAASPSGSAGAFNDQDIAFAQNMIMHHRQALQMAELVADRSSKDQVKELADSVSASQAPEVDLMSRWLGTWGAQVPEDMASMDMSGSMPGMQSLADMTALAGLKGDAFDTKWLAMMQDHHEGAITMAKEQLTRGSDAEAKNLAAQVIIEQGAEIDLIKSLLK